MNSSSDPSSLDSDPFVDIHGREIPTVKIARNKEAVVVSDVRKTSASFYRKSHFSKLTQMPKVFDQDFIDHMLEAAKTYMLNNEIYLSGEDIMSSIENSKRILTNLSNFGTSSSSSEKDMFFKNRTFEVSDDQIRICVSSAPKDNVLPLPQPKRFKQPKKFEKKNTSRNKKSNNDSFSESSSLDDGSKNQSNSPKSKNFENKTNFDKKNLPKKNEQRKKFEYNLDGVFEVFVTHIDKSNCCWVRDKTTDVQMEIVHQKVNDEAKSQKPVPKKEIVMDKVYMARAEEAWYRCKIIKLNPLTVLFLDYGNTAEVAEVRNLSDEMAEFPFLAIRITFKEREYQPCLGDEIRIKRFMQNADGTFFVNVLKKLSKVEEPNSSVGKNPDVTFSVNVLNESPREKEPVSFVADLTQKLKKTQIKIEETEEPAFFNKPSPLDTLKAEQKVVILSEKDGIFFLRTRECFEKVKNVENEIEERSSHWKLLPNVKVDQIVLYRSDKDGKYYRAVVNKIDQDSIGIELLDYTDSYTVNKKTLRTISEQLSKEPVTYIKGGKLSGFENVQFNSECRKLIEEYIRTRKKFVVSLDFDDQLDLFDGDKFLSDHLQRLSKQEASGTNSDRILLKDVKTYKPELGIKSYICGCYNNPNELSLVPTDEFEQHVDYILRSELEDTEPYEPVLHEVCLCYYIEYWYRCVVTRIFDEECEVLLLDFGSIHLINKEQIRKADDKVTELPALALPCVLTNIPDHPNAETMLKNLLRDGEIYAADIKKISNGKCHLEMPTIYAKIY